MGSYQLNKHLTSIKRKKKERQEEENEKTAHTPNRTPEKNDQKGAAKHPHKYKWRELGGGFVGETKRYQHESILAEVRKMVHFLAMQDCPAPQTSLLRNNREGQEGEGGGSE